jgi:hypothetical protein
MVMEQFSYTFFLSYPKFKLISVFDCIAWLINISLTTIKLVGKNYLRFEMLSFRFIDF